MDPSSLVTTTEAVDKAFYIIFGISAFSLLGVAIAMVYFVWRYNRKRVPVPISQKDHNVWLEVIWTIIPTILVMLMFWYGWEGYLSLRRIPDNAMSVKASARMWSWLFTYDNGKTSGKLFVPVGQPIKVELIAEDVLHSFYVPAFRVKRDCVPGMPTYAWFIAEKPGSYDLFCSEYCGVGHADMVTTVEALEPAEFQEWLSVIPAEEETGKVLLQKHGCLGCHSLDGSRMVGPTFQGIAGRSVAVIKDGKEQTLLTDAKYLENAILEPNLEIVKGYPAAMPSYAGRIPVDELSAIIDYLLTLTAEGPSESVGSTAEAHTEHSESKESKVEEDLQEPSLDADDPEAAQGEAIASANGCLGCHSLDGSRRVGPSFQGLFGSQRTVTRNGQEQIIAADDDYLIRAIVEPNFEIVKGYPAAMPPYPNLGEEDLEALIDWLETLQ
ncbi:MAG: cytochrome c oxidase subunit II [Deltaproteobacteria bacterium]|nr:cytochrome c oxidase subunit II [Deltaproteobacteria bacterium]